MVTRSLADLISRRTVVCYRIHFW